MTNIKEIIKDNTAKFAYAIAGVLYYKVETPDKIYIFSVDMNDTDDVGAATFEAEHKAITLMRYIKKAINKDELIEMNKN